MFRFEFHGGIRGIKHGKEQFLLFFVERGEEIPLHTAIKKSLAQSVVLKEAKTPLAQALDLRVWGYETDFQIVKIFHSEKIFGNKPFAESKFFRLVKDGGFPISINHDPSNSVRFSFSAYAVPLNRKEALKLLPEVSLSRDYVKSAKIEDFSQKPLDNIFGQVDNRSSKRVLRFKK
jgi:hypothetical protein